MRGDVSGVLGEKARGRGGAQVARAKRKSKGREHRARAKGQRAKSGHRARGRRGGRGGQVARDASGCHNSLAGVRGRLQLGGGQ